MITELWDMGYGIRNTISIGVWLLGSLETDMDMDMIPSLNLPLFASYILFPLPRYQLLTIVMSISISRLSKVKSCR
jgi:hypothetical protein